MIGKLDILNLLHWHISAAIEELLMCAEDILVGVNKRSILWIELILNLIKK